MDIEPNDADCPSTAVPPEALFVAADEPLLVFPSVAAAERHLETIDVDNGVYPSAFGPNGERYSLRTEGNRTIIERTGEPNRPAELIPLLVRYLEAHGRNPAEGQPFEDLIAEVWAIDADFWREHDPYGDRFGTPIPLWGCVSIVAFVAIAFYILFRWL